MLVSCDHRILMFSVETNPFKRKNPTNLPNARESIRKSDSFFDKVEAVESYFDKKAKKPMFKSPKDKEGPRQATLFGMMPRAFQTSQAPKRGAEEKQIVNGDEDIDEETQSVLDIGLGPEAMEESDSQMTLNDNRGLGDTQIDQETQMD